MLYDVSDLSVLFDIEAFTHSRLLELLPEFFLVLLEHSDFFLE